MAARAGRAALLQYRWHHIGIPHAQPGAQVWFAGLGWMLLVALAVGLPFARCAQRLPVVGALAGVPSLGAVQPGTKTGHDDDTDL